MGILGRSAACKIKMQPRDRDSGAQPRRDYQEHSMVNFDFRTMNQKRRQEGENRNLKLWGKLELLPSAYVQTSFPNFYVSRPKLGACVKAENA